MVAKKHVFAVVKTIGTLLDIGKFDNALTTANHLPDDCPEKNEMLDAIGERKDNWYSLMYANEFQEPIRTEMLKYFHVGWLESGDVFFAKKAKMLLDGTEIWDLDIPKECEGVDFRWSTSSAL